MKNQFSLSAFVAGILAFVVRLLDGLLMPVPRGRLQLGAVDLGDPELIKAELQKISDAVKEEGTKLKAETDKLGDASKAQKEVVDKLLTEQGTLKAQLLEIEQKMAQKVHGGDEQETLASVLKAGEAAIKDFAEHKSQSKHVVLPISRKALTNTGVTGAALNYPGTQLMSMPQLPLLRRLTVRDLLMPGRISGPVAFYPRESGFTNSAAPVSEGSLKPKSELTFEMITEPVRTIAHLMDVSLQMLADVSYIQSYIEGRMRYGLKLVEEAQLLTGSGTGQNLSGVYTEATDYAMPSGAEVANEQDLDKLRLAMLQVELANAFVSGIVLHPTNWANIELLKDANNQYLFTNPQNTTTGRIWGRDVVSTPAITFGKFLVGDFAQHVQILDREDANVMISFENKDNVERNMATIRVEERLALAIYRPEALVRGTLESAS